MNDQNPNRIDRIQSISSTGVEGSLVLYPFKADGSSSTEQTFRCLQKLSHWLEHKGLSVQDVQCLLVWLQNENTRREAETVIASWSREVDTLAIQYQVNTPEIEPAYVSISAVLSPSDLERPPHSENERS